jgi:endoglucanase
MVEKKFEGIKVLQRQLSELIGVSGHEKPVVDFIYSQIEDLVDKIWIDPLGSLLAIIDGKGGKDRIMLDGHVDEIGFMVSHIDKKGFLRFVPIGGWDSRTLLGQSVKILASDNKMFHGITGSKPPHLTTESERKNTVKISDMYIDLGMSSKDVVESSGIQIGSVGTLYDPSVEFPYVH